MHTGNGASVSQIVKIGFENRSKKPVPVALKVVGELCVKCELGHEYRKVHGTCAGGAL